MTTINPLSSALGAEVLGIDLSNSLSNQDFEKVHKAFLDFQVLIIRKQLISPSDQINFSKRFGNLDIHVKSEFLLPGKPEILVLSNKRKEDGSPVGFEDAGRYWHTDISYSETPALGSLLYAIELPPEGGDTLFCNMYTAYESLPNATKQKILHLKAVHSYAASFEGMTTAGSKRATLSKEQRDQLKEVVHPVIRTHPETGRRALYVNPGFTLRIDGMNEQQSKALLDELFAHTIQSKFIFRHQWQENDLVMWDNRCAMHHATSYDPTYIRHMHRTTVQGNRPYLDMDQTTD